MKKNNKHYNHNILDQIDQSQYNRPEINNTIAKENNIFVIEDFDFTKEGTIKRFNIPAIIIRSPPSKLGGLTEETANPIDIVIAPIVINDPPSA